VAREVKRRERTMGLLDAVHSLQAGLDYHLSRQNLLTANLAHIDTPNFKPLDLEEAGGFQSALHVAMQATDPAHFGASATGDAPAEQFRVVADPGASVGSDGNGVNVDREASKLASNNVRYDALASLVSNELSGLEWAANDGKAG
jgi:flagellar basal-body rod protein FlgB